MMDITPLLGRKILRDLFAVCLSKKFKTWEQIQDYARSKRKYDHITFGDLDKVEEALGIKN